MIENQSTKKFLIEVFEDYNNLLLFVKDCLSKNTMKSSDFVMLTDAIHNFMFGDHINSKLYCINCTNNYWWSSRYVWFAHDGNYNVLKIYLEYRETKKDGNNYLGINNVVFFPTNKEDCDIFKSLLLLSRKEKP